MGGVCYGVFFILTEQMLSLSIERSWVNSPFGRIDSEPIQAQGVIVKYSYRAGPTLVKIFQGSLKILEDLHEDPSADLEGSLLTILKDL